MSCRFLSWLLLAFASAGHVLRSDGDAEDLLSLMQVAPVLVQERAGESGGNASFAGASRPEDDAPGCLRNKEVWLLIELLGAGLLGLDRMFLGGTNVLMGLMKLVWCLPTLGAWSTVDRIVIISNAVNQLDSVTTLDMNCGFRDEHIDEAYMLGVACAVASLFVGVIGLAVGAYSVSSMVHDPAVTVNKVVMGVIIYIAGMNVVIALSVPLIVLSAPLGAAGLLVQATSHIWVCALNKIWPSQATPEQITINVVKVSNGEKLCSILADVSWTVPRLKAAIRSELCVPTQMQRLVHQNRPLVDGECLQERLGTTNRLEHLCGSVAGKREPRVFEVGIMQYNIADDAAPIPSSPALCSLDGSSDVVEENVTPPVAG